MPALEIAKINITPKTTPSDINVLFVDSVDNLLKFKDSSSTINIISFV